MRFTIRRMMLAIAIFTVALYVGLSYRQSAEYWRQAQFWARAQGVALIRARNVESGFARLDDDTAEGKRKALDQARIFAEYSSRLKAKYKRAAFLPWLTVEPDPAPP